ncbi:hypothetical protein DWW30_03090 [Bacteroides sp. AF15-14LB]|nr:hypothetical protein DWW72_03100 [Bacteroides sp. AF16-7]RJV70640.1 hypothetical protein DWW30_03090 [Bacteroides sp. AF15-14LB]
MLECKNCNKYTSYSGKYKNSGTFFPFPKNTYNPYFYFRLNPEKPDVPLNKNDAFQKVQKRRVQEKR